MLTGVNIRICVECRGPTYECRLQGLLRPANVPFDTSKPALAGGLEGEECLGGGQHTNFPGVNIRTLSIGERNGGQHTNSVPMGSLLGAKVRGGAGRGTGPQSLSGGQHTNFSRFIRPWGAHADLLADAGGQSTNEPNRGSSLTIRQKSGLQVARPSLNCPFGGQQSRFRGSTYELQRLLGPPPPDIRGGPGVKIRVLQSPSPAPPVRMRMAGVNIRMIVSTGARPGHQQASAWGHAPCSGSQHTNFWGRVEPSVASKAQATGDLARGGGQHTNGRGRASRCAAIAQGDAASVRRGRP